MEFLNKEGVQILWSKVKDKVSSINKESVGLNNVTNDAQVKRSEMGAANGVPTLDANGKIPVDQLGNLDTVVSMVVTELPTTDIKANKIYLVKDSTTEGDLYQEYLYVDNKWEKVGTHKQEVDLTGYAKKSEALKSVESTPNSNLVQLHMTKVDGTSSDLTIGHATSTLAGAMSADDKAKLDSLSNYTLPIASATALGGIKLGSGLSATSDGTVSVSADVVAGSVEWNSIKNIPNVAILDADNTFDSNGKVKTIINGDHFNVVCRPSTSTSLWSTVLEVNGPSVSVNGIQTFDGGSSTNVFMTNGTTQELTAITEDELNTILV